MTEDERRGPLTRTRKTHLVEAQSCVADWPLTLCGHPAGRVVIAGKGQEPTCSVCLRRRLEGRM
jgi:hypothetical protein